MIVKKGRREGGREREGGEGEKKEKKVSSKGGEKEKGKKDYKRAGGWIRSISGLLFFLLLHLLSLSYRATYTKYI